MKNLFGLFAVFSAATIISIGLMLLYVVLATAPVVLGVWGIVWVLRYYGVL